MSIALDNVRHALSAAGSSTRNGRDWTCPAHDDRNPSLSVNEGDGCAVIHCHAGCDSADILSKLGLRVQDLFDRADVGQRTRKTNGQNGTVRSARATSNESAARFIEAYPYTDEQGEVLYEVVRYEPKGFKQRRPDGNGGWTWNLNGVRRVLYKLPDLLQAIEAGDTVFITEGEKDANALHDARCVSTTCSGGAGKWQAEYAAPFRGANVVIVQHRDDPGREHARTVFDQLQPAARSVRIVEAAEGNDAHDHLEAGHSVEDFVDVDPETGRPIEEGFLRLLSADEFLNDVAPDSIVERLVYEGSVHNVTGVSKGGKTYFALQLAMCAAAGVSFLGLDVRAARILLLSFELSAAMTRERMVSIARDTGTPMPAVGEQFQIVAATAHTLHLPLNLATDQGRRTLEGTIHKTRAELVVLDTLYRFLPGSDPNSNAEMGEVFGGLNDLAQSTGAALLVLDHVGKGEQLGPTAHSALGASVKGGAARVIVGLKRTSKQDGGRWEVGVESHFGSWDEAVYYERPRTPNGDRGFGCQRCGATEGFGLDIGLIGRLFDKHGEPDPNGLRGFPSKRRLIEALKAEGYATGNNDGGDIVAALIREHAVPENADQGSTSRPIVTRSGGRNATGLYWRGFAEIEERA